MSRGLRFTEEQGRALIRAADKLKEPQSNATQTPQIEPLRADQASGRRSITLELPWPVSVNHSTAPNGRGGRILTKGHKVFRTAVLYAATVAQPHTYPLLGRLRVVIYLTPPNKRKFDLDNRIKAILDALQHAGVYADDEAIDDLRILRVKGKPGACNVQIEVLT